jgi:serine/threonine-protein kinase
LANALHALGQPWPSVEEALKARGEMLGPAQRARVQWLVEVNFAAMRGDFVLARERAQQQVDSVPAGAGFLEHYLPNFTLLLVLRESGEPEAAGKLADGFLQRVQAWQIESAREAALVLLFVREAHRAGYLDDAGFLEQRARWVKVVDDTIGHGRRTDAYSRSIAWVVGYAAGARTKEDGEEALRELPRYQPLPPAGTRGTDIDLVTGVVYALAGQPKVALPRFESVVRSCYRLENPFAWVYGMQWKGQALEAMGEKAPARAAFEAVRKTWGAARPRSVMAERAAQRLEGL